MTGSFRTCTPGTRRSRWRPAPRCFWTSDGARSRAGGRAARDCSHDPGRRRLRAHEQLSACVDAAAGLRRLLAGERDGERRASSGPGPRTCACGKTVWSVVPVRIRAVLRLRARPRRAIGVQMADYSIWVVEYARVVEFAQRHPRPTATGTRHECRAVLLRGDQGRGPPRGCRHRLQPRRARRGARGESYGVSDWQPADVVLKRIGVDPAEVDTMILTHNHFDHAGGVEFFPNAHVYIQAREVSKYMWAARAARPPPVADDAPPTPT